MSLGGEVSDASAYLAEIAPPNRRGRYSSFFYISTGTAVLLASLLGALLASSLADDQLASWGWRVPFLTAGPRPRRGVAAPQHGRNQAVREEQRQGQGDQEPPDKNAARAPPGRGPADQPHAAHHAVLLHLLLGADTIRGQGNRLDDAMVFWALSIATAMFVVLQYPFGWTADRFGRKPQMLVWSGPIGRHGADPT